MVDLINSDKPRSKLEHVVPQRNDDELCILRSLFDVGSNNRNLMFVSTAHSEAEVRNSHFGSPTQHQSHP